MWYTFALLSALIYSFRGIIEKKIIHRTNKYILGFAIRFFALPFFLIPFFLHPSFLRPVTHLNVSFWAAVLIISFINTPLETVFYYEALKNEELTLVLPVLSLSPVITLLIGSITLHEVPTLSGVIGIGLIVVGLYSLKLSLAKEGLWEPLKHLHNNRGVRLMLVVMLSQGVAAIFDKIGVTNSNAYVYAMFNYLCVSVTLFVLVLLRAKNHLHQLVTQVTNFLILGVVIAGYTLLYFLALVGGFAAYASAIKGSYIIFTIIFGVLFLKEKEGKQKLISGVIIFIGLVLLKLFS